MGDCKQKKKKIIKHDMLSTHLITHVQRVSNHASGVQSDEVFFSPSALATWPSKATYHQSQCLSITCCCGFRGPTSSFSIWSHISRTIFHTYHPCDSFSYGACRSFRLYHIWKITFVLAFPCVTWDRVISWLWNLATALTRIPPLPPRSLTLVN